MINMNKKEPSIIKTWLALAVCAIIFCVTPICLVSCSNSHQSSCMQSQCMIEVHIPTNDYSDEVPIHINTSYITEIRDWSYCTDYIIENGIRKPDKNSKWNGASIYILNRDNPINVKETPEEVLKLATGVS